MAFTDAELQPARRPATATAETTPAHLAHGIQRLRSGTRRKSNQEFKE
jgi:hypothetical protein